MAAMQTIAEAVVVTRPLAQADDLMQRIAALGRTAILFPLLEIHPLADQTELKKSLATLERYALIAFVSPNAIDAAFAARANWPHEIPLAVVGEGSRARLAKYGITDQTTQIFRPPIGARMDSQALLAELDLDALRDKRVLIVRGETGRELLADSLRAAGIQVELIAAYRRAAPKADAKILGELKQLLCCHNVWIVTSSEALQVWSNMVLQLEDAEVVAKMQQKKILVPHARIAETAQQLGFRNIVLTRSGDDGLIAALQSRP